MESKNVAMLLVGICIGFAGGSWASAVIYKSRNLTPEEAVVSDLPRKESFDWSKHPNQDKRHFLGGIYDRSSKSE